MSRSREKKPFMLFFCFFYCSFERIWEMPAVQKIALIWCDVKKILNKEPVAHLRDRVHRQNSVHVLFCTSLKRDAVKTST